MEKLPDEFKNTSISVGTLKPDHLLENFFSFIEDLFPQKAADFKEEFNIKDTYSWEEYYKNSRVEAEAFLETIYDFLNEVAPEGYYFGCHPGNGSDIGFWEEVEIYL